MTVQRVLRSALLPFAALYEAASFLDGRRKQRRAFRSSLSVVSVGNLSAGGTGKTPIVALLAEHLQSSDDVLVLSRGYGRLDKRPRVWRSGEPLPHPDMFGDEPALLARGIRRGGVAVAADRAQLLRSIETSFQRAVVILDDGFQHRRLSRDVDIVVVDEATASTPHRLLPAGRLRERPSALRRADIVLASSEAARRLASRFVPDECIFDFRALPAGIARWHNNGPPDDRSAHGGAPKVTAVRSVHSDDPIAPGHGSPATLTDCDVVLVTGIARPERVRDALTALGIAIAEHLVFADHHRYLRSDVARIVQALDEHPRALLVTTTKDAVKLESHVDLKHRLNCVFSRIEIVAEERFLQAVGERIGATRKRNQ